MLSLFPSLLALDQLSPVFIRITLGAILIYWASGIWKAGRSVDTIALSRSQEKVLGILEGIAGILLIIGLWTQVAALFVGLDLLVRIISKIKRRQFLTNGVNYYLILLVMTTSLLFTGAGFFAFDLPL